MRKVTLLFVFLTFVVFSVNLFAQSDFKQDTKVNVSGNWGMTQSEKNNNRVSENVSVIPKDLMNQYLEAKRIHDEDAKIRLGQEMDKYLNAYPTIDNASLKGEPISFAPMTEGDWGIGDYPVYVGNVASAGGYRQLDMKLGEDGNLYIAVNRTGVSGYFGYLSVYRSSNGGQNWIGVQGVAYATGYIGQISMLVEKRHATLDDSTRVILYYTVSSVNTQDNAALHYVTFLRSGSTSSWYNGSVATPTAGNKFQFPSACSDGMYYSTATYIHCVVQEVTNANAHYRTHHFRTTNWCQTHTSGVINTTYDDFYPSAGFSREVTTSSDSIYVAVERRFSTANVGLRLLVLPEVPSTAVSTYYLTPSTGVKYEKPCLTVQQEYSTTPRKILVTYTKDTVTGKTAKYSYSINGGSSWSVDAYLGSSNQLSDFTWCNSDSTTAGGGYFIAAFVDLNGDSICVRRGVLGSMGTYLYKRNAHASTGILPPVVAIYKEGSNKYSAFAYAGFGPINVYFNQENLAAVNIEPISGNVPKEFRLNQNYPNPFNPVTTVTFDVAKTGLTSLKVYNILGEEVATVVNENLNAGTYRLNFNGTNLSSGVYFYKLVSGEFTDVKKMMILK